MGTWTLPTDWQIPQSLRQRIGESAGRQRAMYTEGHLLLILHKPPQAGETKREGEYFWRDPQGNWTSDDFGPGSGSLERHLQRFVVRLDELERLEEQAQCSWDYFEVLSQLEPLLRTVHNGFRALQQAREFVAEDHDLINVRDHAGDIERTADLLYRDCRNRLDCAMARRAEEQAENSRETEALAHRLNVLAAFFFPIMTLATIFGTNLTHGLETLCPPIPFLVVLSIGVLTGYFLCSSLGRAKGSACTRATRQTSSGSRNAKNNNQNKKKGN
jgi:hypothetical protein